MNLLVLNLKSDLNDPALAHCVLWVDSLAKHFDKVFVISNYVGKLTATKNITYYSLQCNRSTNKLVRIVRFYFLLFRVLMQNHCRLTVFAHMTPLLALMASPILRVFSIPITLWYAHKNVSYTLRLANLLVNKIVTSSRQSFRIFGKTPVYILGHGVYFPKILSRRCAKEKNHIFIHGRISVVKNIHILIESVLILRESRRNLVLNVYGDCLTNKDVIYKKTLLKMIKLNGLEKSVIFHGPINLLKIHSQLQKNVLGLSLTQDWSMDKAGLEVLANGLPLIYTNPDYNQIYEKNNVNFSDYFIMEELNSVNLAQKISLVLDKKQLQNMPKHFINYVRSEYSIESLVARLIPLILNPEENN